MDRRMVVKDSKCTRRWRGVNPHLNKTNARFEADSPKHEAKKLRQREHYHRTAESQRLAANERVRVRRERNQQYVVNYLHGKKCEDCPCDDTRVLTFDHRDPNLKLASISNLVSRGATFKHLVSEIPKCDIVCHNCHALRTFRDRTGGSYHERISPISEEEFNTRYSFLKT